MQSPKSVVVAGGGEGLGEWGARSSKVDPHDPLNPQNLVQAFPLVATKVRMKSTRALLCAAAALVALACDRPAERPEQAPAASGPQASNASHCFRSTSSVLLGPATSSGQQGQGPGWIRIDGGLSADSGTAAIRDANTRTMLASWRRASGDSIDVVAFDDFLRVELRLAVTDKLASGLGASHSDAALERDSTGAMQDLRRNWVLSAPAIACDSMPA
jgi:hypothetical protein